MSSPIAYLIVGVDVSDVYHLRPRSMLVTKYNEDTGEPYQKQVYTYEHDFMGMTFPNEKYPEVKNFELANLFDAVFPYRKMPKEPLRLFTRGEIGDTRVIGLSIEVEHYDGQYTKEIEPGKLEEMAKVVRGLLSEVGFNDPKIKTFLWLS